MMNNLVHRSVKAVLGISLFVSALTVPASADTYKIFDLVTDQDTFFYGMDDSGHVAIKFNGGSFCGTSAGTCYYNFFNGESTGFTTNQTPSFTLDNGTPCTPSVPAGGFVVSGACNNGREVFAGFLDTATQSVARIYTGPSPADELGLGGSMPYINALGDIVWDDARHAEYYEAIDLSTSPTPEPDSLVLVATGALAFLGMARLRTRAARQYPAID